MSIPDPIVLLDARAKYVHPAFQMDRASTKTVFDATGKLVTVPANALGWHHDPATGQSRGYLAEPGATNLLLHSNNLGQSPWATQRASIDAGTVGPDGQSMAKLVESTETGAHYLRQTVNIQAGEAHCYSAIVKAAERTSIYFWAHTQEENRIEAIFHLSDGTYNATTRGEGVVLGAGAIDIGEGFFRVWISGTLGPEDDAAQLFTVLRHSSLGNAYEGDGTSGIYLGYYQVEEGSYPTSYIETGAATATRARDLLQCPSGTGLFLTNKGTFVVDATVDEYPINNAALLSTGESNMTLRYSSGASGFIITGGAVNNATIGVVQGRAIFSMAWDESDDDLQAFVNGVQRLQTDFIAEVSDYAVALGSGTGGSRLGFFRIHRAVYYPARLSNADLQSLTAIQE